MGESVNTGGMKTFVYPKGDVVKRDEDAEEFGKAYREYCIKKRRTKMILKIIGIILILVVILGIVFIL